MACREVSITEMHFVKQAQGTCILAALPDLIISIRLSYPAATMFPLFGSPESMYLISRCSLAGRMTILNKPAYLTDRIQLNYEQNVICFEFASTDFSASDNNRFKYQLAGFDKDWIHSGNTNNATYTNLDPGTYTFTVKGSNNDGTWNEKGTSIQLVILPPWYGTWWFRTAIVLAVLSAAYAFLPVSPGTGIKTTGYPRQNSRRPAR